MTLGLQDILALAQMTLNNPRQGLRAILTLNPSTGTCWAALGLMAVLSAILAQFSAMLMPVQGNPVFDLLMGSPFRTALIQAAGMALTVAMVHVLGRAWGGVGRLDEAILAVAWLQVFLLILQAAQLLTMLVLPPLSAMIGVISVAVFPWLLTMFVTEVHRFKTPFKVFLGILVSAFGLSIALSVLLVATLGPETFTNV